MKIEVNGYLIETKHIYCLTPVVGNGNWFHAGFGVVYTRYSFKIKFLNRKDIDISISGEELFNLKDWEHIWIPHPDNKHARHERDMEEYIRRRDLVKAAVEEMRNFVSSHMDNKTNHPAVDLKTIELDNSMYVPN